MGYKILVTLVNDEGDIIVEHETVTFGSGTDERKAIVAVDILATEMQERAKRALGQVKPKPMN